MPDAVRAFVGNFKGPKGEQGPQGIQGPTGPQGIQGPAGPSNADGIDTVDTLGVLVSAGESTDLQRLIDAIADKVMTKLLAKTDIVQVESTATNKVPSSAYLKQVKDSIDSNLEELDNKVSLMYIRTPATITLPNRDMLLVCVKYDYISSASYAYHMGNPIVTLYNNGFSSGAPSVAVSGNDITITFEKTYFHLFAIFPKVL